MCFFVIKEIAGNFPDVSVDTSHLHVPDHISLADPTYYKPDKIQMLLGSDVFWNVFSVEQISLGKNRPILQKTKLGWIVSGPISSGVVSTSCHLAQFNTSNPDVQLSLAKFWEVENLGSEPVRSRDEQICEDHFVKSTTHDEDGRFVVYLPLKESVTKLGEAFEIAKKRFYSLERKLQNVLRFHGGIRKLRPYEASKFIKRERESRTMVC